MLKVLVDSKREIIYFPDECPMCGLEHPGSTYGLKYGNLVSDLMTGPIDFIKSADFDVPTCDACVTRWEWNRRLHWLGIVGLSLAVVALLKFCKILFPNVWQPLNIQGFKWLVIAGIILLGIPFYGYIMRFLPLPVMVFIKHPDGIEFSFLDEDYGEAFDELNNEAEEDAESSLDNDDEEVESEEEVFDARLAELRRVENQEFDER